MLSRGRYGTFAYKGLVKMPCISPMVYELAEQDRIDEDNSSQHSKVVYDKLITSPGEEDGVA